MYKNLTFISVLGGLAVLLGAFGAHALKKDLTVAAFQSFETAVQYQMYHTLLLLIVNINQLFSDKFKRTLTLVFGFGVVMFSGSIYGIHVFRIPAKLIWFLTPLGGGVLLSGWFLLVYYFFQRIKKFRKKG